MSLLKRFKGIAILFGILFLPLKGWADNRNVLCPVSFENIYIDDFFWYYQFHAQQQNSLPSIWNRLKVQGFFEGRYQKRDLEDADLYQLLETMSYINFVEPDSLLWERLDTLASLVPHELAVNTNCSWLKYPRKESHPLYYQLAAFYRAALAYTRSGGQRDLLHWALQNAEQLSRYIVENPKKIRTKDLHPNMVLALGDLYVLTNNKLLLQAAEVMLREMSSENWGKEQGYYYAAQAWSSALNGQNGVLKENHNLWKKAVNQTMRVTGGFSVHDTLPVTQIDLLETIANMEWCFRLYAATCDPRCMELYERILYNELRAAVPYHGNYVAHDLTVGLENNLMRDPIDEVPMGKLIPLLRNIAVLPDYYYATYQDTCIYINQYFRGEVRIKNKKLDLKLSAMSSMPWEGGYYIDVLSEQPQSCTFYLRVPAWMTDDCLEDLGRYRFIPVKKHLRFVVNGKELPIDIENGFLKVSGTWKKNDRILFDFLSSVRKIVPKESTEYDTMQVAYQRAPFVFCQEEPDTVFQKHQQTAVCLTEGLAARFALGLMGGVQTLEGKLYYLKEDSLQSDAILLTPFFAKGQRGRMNTKIWFPYFIKNNGR